MSEMATEKIYCMPTHDNSQLLAELINAKGTDAAEMAALFNQNNNWNNNPFMYLIWLAFFGGNGFGFNRGNGGLQDAEIMSRLNSMERQAQDNHNNELAMDAIRGNHAAVHELAGNLNVGVAALNQAIDRVQAGIAQVANVTGLTGERVINAVSNGNLNLVQQIKDCCCQTQQNIIRMGYENQLGLKDLINQMQRDTTALGYSLGERLTGIANGIQLGFSATAYENQRQTCDIINSGKDNTQRIIDTLNNHWSQATSQALQDQKFENSQLKQNMFIYGQINGNNAGSIWS